MRPTKALALGVLAWAPLSCAAPASPPPSPEADGWEETFKKGFYNCGLCGTKLPIDFA